MTTLRQAQCLTPECGFTWPTSLQVPAPGATEISVASFRKVAQAMRCPRCVKEGRETSYETIGIGERASHVES